ncbi:MAG: hypothetical protein A3E88_06495 [Legionellales bacterium RIFCSPHIGHO2_12_FULL_35_11]|nr:MAG: hypothetical protein A3E88_06495 [Legionellales bacterium RIFCSPHIGHO2_12_FULL_35_11]
MIEKIVSGGQTGVDQAVLFTASEFGIPIGGWCPKGGLDENDVCILDQHPSLMEATTTNPDERTKLNIRDSDGTLIIVPSWPLPEKIKDGTKLTIEEAQHRGKPHLIVSLAEKQFAVENILQWVDQNNIHTLNVGGPRESNCPGVYQETCELFHELFIALDHQQAYTMGQRK